MIMWKMLHKYIATNLAALNPGIHGRMDLWWNAAVEAQAWDRVHRIGQTKPVRVVR